MARKTKQEAVISPPLMKPIQIPLLEGVPLEGGAMFVRLRTPGELEQFWIANRGTLLYSAEGGETAEGNDYLGDNEWVFAPTKAAVVKTVMRWNDLGVICEWYDWTTRNPDSRANYFAEREWYRGSKKKKGQWTATDEEEYQKRSSKTYTGWWRLANLPMETAWEDWLSGYEEEVADKDLPMEQVATMLQEQTFDHCGYPMGIEVEFRDAKEIEEYIAFWKESADEEQKGDTYPIAWPEKTR
jgi:hypothetical protein